MHCCLLVSRIDFEIIQKKEFNKLSFGLREIIKALSKSKAITKISLGPIYLEEDKSKSSFYLNSIYNKLILKIDTFTFKVSRLIDWIDAKINRYTLKPNQLQSEHIINFKKKLCGVYKFLQFQDNAYSYTYIDSKFKNCLPNFDFLFRGSGLKIEKGKILSSYSKLGCLSLHHGDNLINRGGPVGFWEVYYRQSSGITAQILSSELDGGVIIYRSRLRTLMNPFANYINIYKNTCPTLLVTFNKIKKFNTKSSNSWISHNKINLYSGMILKLPRWYKSLSLSSFHLLFTCLFLPIRLYMLIKSLFCNPYSRWGISVTTEIEKRLEKWTEVTVNTNSKRKDDWVADPFFARVGGLDYIIFEQFRWLKRKGEISYKKVFYDKKNNTLTLSDENKLLLENNFHLSYPCTFERYGNTYMIPENNYNGLCLYQIMAMDNEVNDDLKVRKIQKLLDGRCMDPTLFHYEGVDYVFVTEVDETKETLFLFMSDDITKFPLNQHPDSPILVDHSLGRSAGRIFVNNEGKIIRPSQKSDRYYGEGIIFSEIKLNKIQFEIIGETERIIPPKYSSFKHLHHFDFRDGMFVCDYVKKKNFPIRPFFKNI